MNPKDMDSQNPSPPTKKRSLLGPMIGVGSFLLLIVILAYVNSRLEIIEDNLQYRPPAPPVVSDRRQTDQAVTGQTVYVPVYSHVYSLGGQPFLLEATLSVRNTDQKRPISVTSVRYYDTKGTMIEDFLKAPLQLAPLESTELLVEKKDKRGGAGANFIVEWSATQKVNEPIIEAVMVGIHGSGNISFVSPGRAISKQDQEPGP